jgi:folylpolyglutamate synthase
MQPSFPLSCVHVKPSIADAVRIVHDINAKARKPLKVLVTGSLHLVGGAIEAAGLAKQAL